MSIEFPPSLKADGENALWPMTSFEHSPSVPLADNKFNSEKSRQQGEHREEREEIIIQKSKQTKIHDSSYTINRPQLKHFRGRVS